MTTSIASGDYDNARKQFQRHYFYLSVLKPKTLWSAENTVANARGTFAITFDTGAGLDFTAVEAGQELWVGTSSGDKDLAVLRIRSISSGDAGVTGTVNVAWHGYSFGPGAFLTFVHDYPVAAKYPWLGQTGLQGTDEVFYKDVFDTYTDQTQSTKIKPVVDVDISHRAGFLVGGKQSFWVDASPSYTMAPGATISSYALSVYPTTGVAISFSTSTGIGRVVTTSLVEEYYWIKFTVTDSNGTSRSIHVCVFTHDPDPASATYPIKDFSVGQYSDDWESGGLSSRITLNKQLADIFSGDRASTDMIDVATAVLWKETVMGKKYMSERRVPRHHFAQWLFIDPDITMSVVSSATCDIDTTFHAGIRIDNVVPADSTTVDLHVQVNAETPIAVTGTVVGGIITATPPTINALAGACSGGTLKWLVSGDVIATEEIWPGKVVVGDSIYPSAFLAHPFNMLVGYLRENTTEHDTGSDVGETEYELSSPEAILKNNYMFSIPIDAKQSPTKWYHFHSQMTTAAAAFFIADFHSTLLEVIPVAGLDSDTRPRPYGEFQANNLYAMMDSITRSEGIRAHFKADRNGKLHLVHDVQLMTDSERGALPTASVVAKQDRAGELQIAERPEPNIALVYGSGIFWDGSFNPDGKVQDDEVEAYCSLAPFYVPNWSGGASTSNFERQTVDSQAHLNELTGRMYGRASSRFPTISHSWRGDYLWFLNGHFEEFWTITIAAADNIKGLIFTTAKIILRSVECTINVASGTMGISTTWEPEVSSLDGVTATCPEIDITLLGIPPLDWRELPGTILTAS